MLERIQQRVLWLAVRIVDAANRERPPDEIKVGGHQASSASMVGIMTALWFAHLTGEDKVAVKPHASPVYHAIKYLTGELDRSYLTRLRALGGLQSYPSRTKDPDVADFSTGSVGLGVVAPLFAAAARRYVERHFGPRTDTAARFIALAGDAELDEGNVWEAIADPALQGLGNVMWVVDTNRQSLDRVVPDQKIKKLMELFDGAGWHVVEAKYGHRLTAAFARPGGDALRRHIDDMSNEEYQSLFAHHGAELREKFLAGADETPALRRVLDGYTDDEIAPLVQNLGGHDLRLLIECYRACDAVHRPPERRVRLHREGLGPADRRRPAEPLRPAVRRADRRVAGLARADRGGRVGPVRPHLTGRAGVPGDGERAEQRAACRRGRCWPIPNAVGVPAARATSTQETFGRILTRLGDVDGVGERIVTTSPDVSVSTNLGGWINKMGVFAPEDRPDYLGDERLLRWKQAPAGHHVELGISEMNLFLLLHAFGLGHDLHGEHLLPIGTVYDPFVCRGLDALIYALYSGARFVVVGTPAGITLAPEGGAHQSTITPSIGLELPGLTYAEPAFAQALDWLLCDGLARLGAADGTSLYLRLSTRPIDQAPFVAAAERLGEERLRADVLAGGYRLREPSGPAGVVLATCGPVVPEVLAAAEALEAEGVPALVLDLTSPDRLYREWRYGLRDSARRGHVRPPTATSSPV